MALNRRTFLQQGATLVAASWAVPSFIAETARILDSGVRLAESAEAAQGRIFVIVQFAGGNDGINTLIPYGDPVYYDPSIRPTLAIDPSMVLPLTDYVGLHPSMTRLRSRWDLGQVALAQGVSYPNPNRSHFRGTDIWETAVPERLEPTGWMGRYLQACSCGQSNPLQALGAGMSNVPRTFWTEMALVPAVASFANFRYTSVNNGSPDQRASEIRTLKTALDVADGQPEAEFLRSSIRTALDEAETLAQAGTIPVEGTYSSNGFGNAMKMVAQVIKADVGTSIFYVSLGGFDTHSNQLPQQANLLSTFDQSVDALLVDMERIGRLNDVVLMTFSEFGRRVAQNGSNGTDHGVAAPHFVIGGSVNGGLYSQYPSMTDLMNGDLKMQVDFRSMYATVLQDWLNIPADGILGGAFPTLGLFGAAAGAAATAPSTPAALRRLPPVPVRRQSRGGRP